MARVQTNNHSYELKFNDKNELNIYCKNSEIKITDVSLPIFKENPNLFDRFLNFFTKKYQYIASLNSSTSAVEKTYYVATKELATLLYTSDPEADNKVSIQKFNSGLKNKSSQEIFDQIDGLARAKLYEKFIGNTDKIVQNFKKLTPEQKTQFYQVLPKILSGKTGEININNTCINVNVKQNFATIKFNNELELSINIPENMSEKKLSID